MSQYNCIIMGAAGRDFHDFQTFFLSHPEMRVRAFTASQIPFIEKRVFPRELTSGRYDDDIPIYSEDELPRLIHELDIDFVFLSYSDLSHLDVMHKASLVQAKGAGFVLLGPHQTQLRSAKPVIAVTAVRTGAGKSPLSQWLALGLKEAGYRPGIIRHPMPYGDLTRQRVERLAAEADLDRFECTIEEREEFEPYIDRGLVIYAGVDYSRILRAAEAESDLILWDGGNNDSSFIRPDLSIVVVDALRAGHETAYYPGETNLRSADIVVINKVETLTTREREAIRETVGRWNAQAALVEADLEIEIADESLVCGRRALVVEDGPTLTHGGMAFGAGTLAARRAGAAEIIDPRPFAAGSIAAAFRQYPHLDKVLPALGYSHEQIEELSQTIAASRADVVVDASPARLDNLIELSTPLVRVFYTFRQRTGPSLVEAALGLLERGRKHDTETQ